MPDPFRLLIFVDLDLYLPRETSRQDRHRRSPFLLPLPLPLSYQPESRLPPVYENKQ
jgi:hypothetical protein